MDIDPKVLPDKEGTETTVQTIPAVDEEKEALKIKLSDFETKNLELEKQKEHWRNKYERDISAPIPPTDYEFGDEDLKTEVSLLKKEINSFKEQSQFSEVISQFPVIKDKKEEFDEFRQEYPGLSLEKAAKLFIFEKGLATESPRRKGLETPTAGNKEIIKDGMSGEDLKRLRETQPRKYEQLLKSGKLNLDKIN